jgi:hypothetical protein
MKNSFQLLFANFSWKKLLYFLPVPILAQIESVIYPLIGLLVVISLDLLTALVTHFNKKSIEKGSSLSLNDYRNGIASYKLRRTIVKGYQYGIGILVTFFIESVILEGPIEFIIPIFNKLSNLTQFIIWACVAIEVKSIDENVKGISGKSMIESVANIFTYFRDIIGRITGPKDNYEWDEEDDAGIN